MHSRHPRVELLVEAAREEANICPANWNERTINGDALISLLFDNLLERSRNRQDCLSGAGPSVECNHGNIRVEKEIDCEPLFLISRMQSPRLCRGGREEVKLGSASSGEGRLRPSPEHHVFVLSYERRRINTQCELDAGRCVVGLMCCLVDGDGSVTVQRVNDLGIGVNNVPARLSNFPATACWLVFDSAEAEVRCFDAKRGVVRHHHCWRLTRLAERCSDDPVVSFCWVKPMLHQCVVLHAVHFDSE